ncbi:hypothetical protein, partial [Segatella salivae]
VFPRSPKVVSRIVWCFRAWRKSFPEWFDISALGESYFPNDLVLAGVPQIAFKRFWRLRAFRKSLFKGFDACGAPARNICVNVLHVAVCLWL